MSEDNNNLPEVVEVVDGGLSAVKAQTQEIIKEILTLIKNNENYSEIVSTLAKKYRKSESTIKTHYTTANKHLRELYTRELTDMKHEHLASLEADMKEAKTNYQMADDPDVAVKWYKLYQDIKKTIREFYPQWTEKKEAPIAAIQINIDRDDEKL